MTSDVYDAAVSTASKATPDVDVSGKNEALARLADELRALYPDVSVKHWGDSGLMLSKNDHPLYIFQSAQVSASQVSASQLLELHHRPTPDQFITHGLYHTVKFGEGDAATILHLVQQELSAQPEPYVSVERIRCCYVGSSGPQWKNRYTFHAPHYPAFSWTSGSKDLCDESTSTSETPLYPLPAHPTQARLTLTAPQVEALKSYYEATKAVAHMKQHLPWPCAPEPDQAEQEALTAADDQ